MNKLIKLDYDLIQNALDYYESLQYKYIETNWLISKEADDFTRPFIATPAVVNNDRYFIGSAEQSFIDKIFNNQLKDEEPIYYSVSPCLRLGDTETDYHTEEFLKVELNTITNNEIVAINLMNKFKNDAKRYFKEISNENILEHAITDMNIDLEINGIEVGSYGYRELYDKKDGYYIVYGTGLAVPRFRQLIKGSGYHQRGFVKGQIGEVSKIFEEFEEFKDAVKVDDKILQLCELSDLMGSIDEYVRQTFNLCLEDLIKNNHKTKKAFEVGRRA